MVEVAEVGHYNRHGQGDGQNTSDGTHRAHHFPPHRDWVHVAVSYCSHGDDCPPEAVWYADEVCLVVVSFCKVDGAGEEDDADEQEENQEAELAHAGPQRLAENLEALRMSRQLEDPEDPHQSDDPDDGQGCGGRGVVVFDQLRPQSDKVRQDGAEIDDVHDVLEELGLAGTAGKAHDELKGEPAYAHGLHHEERVVENTWRRRQVLGSVLSVGMVLLKRNRQGTQGESETICKNMNAKAEILRRRKKSNNYTFI